MGARAHLSTWLRTTSERVDAQEWKRAGGGGEVRREGRRPRVFATTDDLAEALHSLSQHGTHVDVSAGDHHYVINRAPSPGEKAPREIAEAIARLPKSDRARLSFKGALRVNDDREPGTWSVMFPQLATGAWVTVAARLAAGQGAVATPDQSTDSLVDVIERTTERRKRGRYDPLVYPVDAPTAEQRRHDRKIAARALWGGAAAGALVSWGVPWLVEGASSLF